MFKLIEMLVTTIVCGMINYIVFIFYWLPRVENLQDFIYALVIPFSFNAFAQTMWLIGIAREDHKRVHNESRSSRLSARRNRNLN